MKMFKVVYGKSSPVEVEAEIPEWPNLDADGEEIFENTHFLNVDEAWEKLLIETAAGVSLNAMSVIRIRKDLAEMEKKLVDATLIEFEVKGKYRELRASGPPEGAKEGK